MCESHIAALLEQRLAVQDQRTEHQSCCNRKLVSGASEVKCFKRGRFWECGCVCQRIPSEVFCSGALMVPAVAFLLTMPVIWCFPGQQCGGGPGPTGNWNPQLGPQTAPPAGHTAVAQGQYCKYTHKNITDSTKCIFSHFRLD